MKSSSMNFHSKQDMISPSLYLGRLVTMTRLLSVEIVLTPGLSLGPTIYVVPEIITMYGCDKLFNSADAVAYR